MPEDSHRITPSDRGVPSSTADDEQRFAQYEPIIDLVGDGVYQLDLDGKFVAVNDEIIEATGYDREQLLGEHVSLLLDDEDIATVTSDIRQLIEHDQQGVRTQELTVHTADGSTLPVEVRFSLVQGSGDVQGTVGVVRDISHRREREDAFRRERDLVKRILEAVSVSVAVITEDGEITQANEQAGHWLGIEMREGEHYRVGDRDIYDEDGRFIPPEERPYMQVFETGESVRNWECQIDLPNRGRRWLSINAIPLTGGESGGEVDQVVVTAEDITRLKHQARQLRRQRDELASELDEVFERIDDGFYALDDEFRFTHVNQRAEELLQYAETDLLGRDVREVFPGITETPVREDFNRALKTQEPVSFEVYSEPLGFWVGANVYPSNTGLSVYFQDITERKQREHQLRQERDRFTALFESIPEAVVHIRFEDDEPIIQNVNSEFEVVFGYSRQDLTGASLNEYIVPERYGEEATRMDNTTKSMERHEAEVIRQTADGEREFLFRGDPFEAEDDTVEGIGVYIDITDRKERERTLKEYETIIETIPDGVYVLDEAHQFALVNSAFCELTGYTREELLGVDAAIVSTDQGHERGLELREQLRAGEIDVAVLEEEIQTAAGDTSDAEIRFVPLHDDTDDFRGTAGVVRDITDRLDRERELKRQREQLAALNELNIVAREITDAVIERSTRDEVEHVVCDQLATSESYRFAWIGEVEHHGDAVRVRAEAGTEDYCDTVDISLDADKPTGQGPTARAFRTGQIQVVQDIVNDPAYEPWRDHAEEYGFRSSAAIPIVYEGTTYGVLNVYAERPRAFDDEEQDVIGQLGEVVGHAINAIERKQALMSDEVVELEFMLQDILTELNISEPEGGRITLDRAVPLGDDEFLEFGTATGDAIETLEALTDVVPHFGELTILTEGANTIRYELHLDEPPVLSAVAAHGGRVQRATIEDGDYRMSVELPPSVSVQRITKIVKNAYPAAEMLAQRQITRQDLSPERLRNILDEELTDRQRTALETAYYAGFFDWPRESTGEDVAASMNVSPATFHEHLRVGQNKLLGALFDHETATTRTRT